MDAGIERARAVIACVDSDAENVFVVLSARQLNAGIPIIARASNHRRRAQAAARRRHARDLALPHERHRDGPRGADAAGVRRAWTWRPSTGSRRSRSKPGRPADGRTIGDVRGDAIIVGVRHADGSFLPQPPGDTGLHAGDVILALGQVHTLERLESDARPAAKRGARRDRAARSPARRARRRGRGRRRVTAAVPSRRPSSSARGRPTTATTRRTPRCCSPSRSARPRARSRSGSPKRSPSVSAPRSRSAEVAGPGLPEPDARRRLVRRRARRRPARRRRLGRRRRRPGAGRQHRVRQRQPDRSGPRRRHPQRGLRRRARAAPGVHRPSRAPRVLRQRLRHARRGASASRSRRARAARSRPPTATRAAYVTDLAAEIEGAARPAGRRGRPARRRAHGRAGRAQPRALPRPLRPLVQRALPARGRPEPGRARVRRPRRSRAARSARTARCGCAPPTSATTRTASSSAPAASTPTSPATSPTTRRSASAASTCSSTSGAPTTTATCSACRPRSRRSAADPDQLELLIMQFVHLVEGGERGKMSKRAGEFVTLDDLIDDIGVDAARWFLLAALARHVDRPRPRPRAQPVQREPRLLRPVRARPHRVGAAQGGGGARRARRSRAPSPSRPPGCTRASARSSRRLLDFPDEVARGRRPPRAAPHRRLRARRGAAVQRLLPRLPGRGRARRRGDCCACGSASRRGTCSPGRSTCSVSQRPRRCSARSTARRSTVI